MAFEIDISNNQEAVEVDAAQLRRTAAHVLERLEVSDGSVSVAVTDDREMLMLTETYFGVAESTDVLSFDLRDEPRGGEEREAPDCDIVVNAECAVRAAGGRGGDAAAELNLYIVHGLLHQLGYDDQTPDQARAMHAKEDELLEELGFGKVFGGRGS